MLNEIKQKIEQDIYKKSFMMDAKGYWLSALDAITDGRDEIADYELLEGLQENEIFELYCFIEDVELPEDDNIDAYKLSSEQLI